MAAFSPIKAGGWAFGEVLTSGQMNQLNTDFPFALNGRDGASYTPSAPIVVAGSGMTITLVGTSTLSSGFLNLANGTETHAQNGSQVFLEAGSELHIDGLVVAGGGSFVELDGVVSLNGAGGLTLNSPCPLVCNYHATFNSTTLFNSNTGLAGSTTISGLTGVTADVAFSGSASIVQRIVLGTASNSTYSVSTADTVFIGSGLANGTYTYTLNTTGATVGKTIRFAVQVGSASGLKVDLRDGGGISLMPGGGLLSNTTGSYLSATLQVISAGVWRVVQSSLVP